MNKIIRKIMLIAILGLIGIVAAASISFAASDSPKPKSYEARRTVIIDKSKNDNSSDITSAVSGYLMLSPTTNKCYVKGEPIIVKIKKNDSTGKLTATSSNKNVATAAVIRNQLVIEPGSVEGTATITVKMVATSKFNSARATCTVTTEKQAGLVELNSYYGQSTKKTDVKTVNITKNLSGGNLSVVSSNPDVGTAKIEGSTLIITPEDKEGTTTITVKSPSSDKYKSAEAIYTFSYEPEKEAKAILCENGNLTFIFDNVTYKVGGTSNDNIGNTKIVKVYQVPTDVSSPSDVPWNNNSSIISVNFSSNFKDYSVGSTAYWFYETPNLRSVSNPDSLNTNTIENMSYMFKGAGKNVDSFGADLSSWNIQNVTDTSHMFEDCGKNATSWNIGNVSDWDISHVTDMSYMFSNIPASALELRNWLPTSCLDASHMFEGCSNLEIIRCINDWNSNTNISNSIDMFNNCKEIIGGNGTLYNLYKVDKSYARLDNDEKPGYFTDQIKEAGNIELDSYSSSILIEEGPVKVNITKNKSGGTITINSSNETIATASINGQMITITPLKPGKATINIQAASTESYRKAYAKYTINVSASLSGDVVRGVSDVKLSDGNELTLGEEVLSLKPEELRNIDDDFEGIVFSSGFLTTDEEFDFTVQEHTDLFNSIKSRLEFKNTLGELLYDSGADIENPDDARAWIEKNCPSFTEDDFLLRDMLYIAPISSDYNNFLQNENTYLDIKLNIKSDINDYIIPVSVKEGEQYTVNAENMRKNDDGTYSIRVYGNPRFILFYMNLS